MRDLCAGAGISFTVFMLPDFTQAFDERYPWQTIHDAVAGWGRELNVPVFDLLALFRDQDHQALWVPWDGHPNPEAHRQMAAFLAARILDE
jgi:hypothetical protein